jgi:plasmid maintenance system antidote protein VapI
MAAPVDDTRAGLPSPVSFQPSRDGMRDALRDGLRDGMRDGVGDGAGDGVPAPAPAGRDLVVRQALEVSRLTVTRMAEELGIPRATLEAYRLGTRRMPPATRLRFAAYLAQHAELLRRVAQTLGSIED